MSSASTSDLVHGIRDNLGQFAHQVLQVFFVGLTLGMMRTVIPALSESEFGVPRGSFMLLTSFVVAFGVVKGTLNFAAGRLSERLGRRNVLFIGWLSAVPIPFMIWYAPDWDWIVAATVLLGVNQGFTWSMTQTSKLDLARGDQRGFAIGINEFAGYVGVAVAGIITAYLAEHLGARAGLLLFGLVTVAAAGIATLLWVKDTLAWARLESAQHAAGTREGPRARYPQNVSTKPGTWEMFTLMSWRDRRMAAFSQAGLIEKFVDALVWVIYPVWLYQQGVSLPRIGWIVGVYGIVWGVSQFFTGRLSDRIGRLKPIVWGMWLCGLGVALMPFSTTLSWQIAAAALAGFGMALLYPNLSAAVADIAHPDWRGSAIGIYRFWRDLGYGIGALMLGIVSAVSGTLDLAFWFVAAAMALSGLHVRVFAEETLPRLNPADDPAGPQFPAAPQSGMFP
ncbi:MAG TPA: MFS transporter [Gammaproteobacteria bacterium]